MEIDHSALKITLALKKCLVRRGKELMEKKFFREVTVVLLPPLLNQLELSNGNSTFLDLGDIINSAPSLLVWNEKKEENPSVFINKIARTEFSKEVTNLINSKGRELASTRLVLINYPMNKDQLEYLEKALRPIGFSISSLVVTSLTSFDVLATAKEENFLCPVCFKSYAKKTFSSEDRYLCPLDKQDFSISYVDKFTDYLTTYYLQNSIEVIQDFTKNENQEGRRVLNLSVNLGDNLAEIIRKNLSAVAQKEYNA